MTMRCSKIALFTLLLNGIAVFVEPFSSSIRNSKKLSVVRSPFSVVSSSSSILSFDAIVSTSKLSVGASDEEDNDEEVSEEPLADGLDSVLWLPSLSDQNNDVISSVRDVRGLRLLFFFRVLRYSLLFI